MVFFFFLFLDTKQAKSSKVKIVKIDRSKIIRREKKIKRIGGRIPY